MVVNSTNINKTNSHISPKESLNRDGGQLIPPISTKPTIASRKKVLIDNTL
jgi:hypothetical protein